MFELEMTNSLDRWQYMIFKVVQLLIFLGTLCQILNKHFHIGETVAKWASLAAERVADRREPRSAGTRP